jgi:DNA-binding FadR family transcriptional regulator
MADSMIPMPSSKTEHVAQQLLDQIVTAGLKSGSSMGKEADLLAQFDVSRPTLREGLRILESQGVLELRPGPGGGIIVRKPSTEFLSHVLSVYLRLNGVPFIDVLRARELIEPALAAEAAQNGSEADFLELEQSVQRMESMLPEAAFIEENRVFHSVIARASGNKVLETFWATISIVAHGETHGVHYTVGNQQHVIDAHRKILKACHRRDSKGAAAAMDAHVTELEHLVRKRYKQLLKQPTSVVARSRRPSSRRADRSK